MLKAVLSQKPADGNGVPLNAYGQKRNCFTGAPRCSSVQLVLGVLLSFGRFEFSLIHRLYTQVLLSAYTYCEFAFLARKGPFCGNLLVEEGEECDCGFEQSECDAKGDSCCHPRSPDPRVGCTLKRGKACRFVHAFIVKE